MSAPKKPQPWETLAVAPLDPIHRYGRKRVLREQKKKKPTKPQSHYEPTDSMRNVIANMAAFGLKPTVISAMTGIRATALWRHYSQELRYAGTACDIDVFRTAYLQAVGGPNKEWERADGVATRFWLERRNGWRPPPDRLLSLTAKLDFSKLSDDELDQLQRLLEAAGDSQPALPGPGGEGRAEES